MNRVLISAAHKSSGKTTVSIGLCAALCKRGISVQPFKKGPDYIDPLWLSQASGLPCRNLDLYLMQAEEIEQSFARSHADFKLVEGNKGLYDGLALDGSNSNAALAKMLKLPVVLVIDARGMTRGIAPLILGYQAFDKDINIAGVILNNLGGKRHEAKLRDVIAHYTGIPVIGAIQHDKRLNIDERHLGLVPSNESAEANAMIQLLGDAIEQQVDIDMLLSLTQAADESAAALAAQTVTPAAGKVRIGIARDSAFAFYYTDDLDTLQQSGAELIPINLLQDKHLPQLDGLFIGGGFPEMLAAQLEANSTMRQQIKSAIEHGLPTYAECGGLMYLSRQISYKGQTHAMAGVIPGDVVMHDRPVGRGYVHLSETNEHLWPHAAAQDNNIKVHEFHYSSLEQLPPQSRFAYRVTRGHGIDGKHDGYLYKNLLACYAHQHNVGNCHWAQRFVSFVKQVKQTQPIHAGVQA